MTEERKEATLVLIHRFELSSMNKIIGRIVALCTHALLRLEIRSSKNANFLAKISFREGAFSKPFRRPIEFGIPFPISLRASYTGCGVTIK